MGGYFFPFSRFYAIFDTTLCIQISTERVFFSGDSHIPGAISTAVGVYEKEAFLWEETVVSEKTQN